MYIYYIILFVCSSHTTHRSYDHTYMSYMSYDMSYGVEEEEEEEEEEFKKKTQSNTGDKQVLRIQKNTKKKYIKRGKQKGVRRRPAEPMSEPSPSAAKEGGVAAAAAPVGASASVDVESSASESATKLCAPAPESATAPVPSPTCVTSRLPCVHAAARRAASSSARATRAVILEGERS